jgi:hypothetical protein
MTKPSVIPITDSAESRVKPEIAREVHDETRWQPGRAYLDAFRWGLSPNPVNTVWFRPP